MSERDDERMRGHVVVGTAPGEAARSAVRYAAREAWVRRVPLELVRVVPAGPAADSFSCDLLEDGRRLALAEASGVEVTLSLLTDHGVERLMEQAAHAQLLVVGAPTPGPTERLRPGSAALSAAGHAGCPVVVVPSERPPVGQLQRIVVGLKSPARAEGELLTAAFGQAQRHRAELAVVHAWQPPAPHAQGSGREAHDPGWLPGEAALVEDRLARLRHVFPDVQLRVDVVRGGAADALVAASPPGSVLMLSRSRARGPARALGPTARAALQRARCPVLLVPAARPHTDVQPRTLAGLAHH